MGRSCATIFIAIALLRLQQAKFIGITGRHVAKMSPVGKGNGCHGERSTVDPKHLMRYFHLEYLPAVAQLYFNPIKIVGQGGIEM